LLASAASARLGPQKNWPRPAIVVAAATTWAILMIRLTVTQIHTGTRLPAADRDLSGRTAAMAPAIRGARAH
jgi:hypothetical protein